jgi:hypothetical protein
MSRSPSARAFFASKVTVVTREPCEADALRAQAKTMRNVRVRLGDWDEVLGETGEKKWDVMWYDSEQCGVASELVATMVDLVKAGGLLAVTITGPRGCKNAGKTMADLKRDLETQLYESHSTAKYSKIHSEYYVSGSGRTMIYATMRI